MKASEGDSIMGASAGLWVLAAMFGGVGFALVMFIPCLIGIIIGFFVSIHGEN